MKRPDFISNFIKWTGKSECPEEYLRWAAISLLAAACGNRIYTTQWIGHQEVHIYPNLYVMLVGDSGNFKSFASSRINKILDATDYREHLNLYCGHVTHAGMYDAMRTTKRIRNKRKKTVESLEYPQRKQLYLLTDELANDFGEQTMADLLMRALTKLYTLQPFDDRTRYSGHVHLEGYSVNWFAATTLEWLIKTLTRNMLIGGPLGRIVTVLQDAVDTRIFRIPKPSNWDSLFQYLTARVDEIFTLHGHVKKTKAAWEIEEAWYMSRPTPKKNDPTMGSWRRQYTLSIKLSLLLALSRHKTEIDDEDVTDAQEMTEQIVKWQKELMPSIEKGEHKGNSERLLDWMRTRKQVKRSELSKVAFDKYGIKSNELDQLVRTWLDAKFLEEEKRPRIKGGTVYVVKEKQ